MTNTSTWSATGYEPQALGDLTMYIGGEWVEAADRSRLDVFDPAVGATIATVPNAKSDDVDQAVVAARSALEGPWGAFSPRDRSTILYRIANVIRRDCTDLATLEMQDTGKTLAAAIGDIEEAAYLFEYYAGWVTKISGEIPPVGGRSLSLIRSKPVGVAALITPWNFPLLMVAQKAAPALAAGCTCIVKPAEQTPLSALRLGAIAEEVGLPPGTLNVITGDGASAGVPLVRHLGIDMISFTGSVPVGKDIGAVAGGNLKRVTLELGGKSASIVFPDADLERAVEGLCNAGFFNQGQVCGACSRIYLHEDVYDTVLERIGHFVESLIPGHGLDPSTTLGPLISAEHRRRVASFVERGREEGGEILFEGTVPAQPSLRGGYFFAPVVVGGASPTATLSQNEVFGPVVTVQSFRTTDEVIGLVNGTDYGLAGSVWTTDLTTALSVADAIDSGTVWVNDSLKAVSEAMWGGVKNSGVGRELGRAGLDEYLEKRQIYLTLP